MRTLRSVVVASVLLSLTLFAHVDDSGDVHPHVKVEDGKFVIYFRNTEGEKTLRTTLGTDGTILKEREYVPSTPDDKLPQGSAEVEAGIILPQPEACYVIPRNRPQTGKRFVLKLEGEKTTQLDLEWDSWENAWVHGALFTDKFLVLTASRSRGATGPVFFCAFSRESWAVEKEEPFGKPIRIYGLPRVSEVSAWKGHAYCAWMGSEKDKGTALNLSQFDPKTGRTITKRISKGHWNSSPSIAILDGNIAIAFHQTESTKSHGGDAKIVVKSHSLDALFRGRRGELDSASQPATAPELKPEDKEKTKSR